jgi:hypothetical protein
MAFFQFPYSYDEAAETFANVNLVKGRKSPNEAGIEPAKPSDFSQSKYCDTIDSQIG